LGALGLGEAGEELVFGVALRLGGAFELLLPLLGDGDDVAGVGRLRRVRVRGSRRLRAG
jgi:hypothetical protein